MTKNKIFFKYGLKFKAELCVLILNIGLLILIGSLYFCLSSEIQAALKTGIIMCYTTIIPSVFPFFIISDLMLSFLSFEEIPSLRRGFERCFGINGYAISAFVCGAFCGFPVGVKTAAKLYNSDIITKNECENLIGLCNNASPAFVIFAVGCGMRGSLADGVTLYVTAILSAMISTALLRASQSRAIPYNNNERGSSKPHFSLTASIKNATLATLNICGFISFFSIVVGIAQIFIKNELILLIISSFLEIGNASSLISSAKLPNTLSLALTSFAVSFSGLSVHLQAKSMLENCDISMKKYYAVKLLSAVISFFICLTVGNIM